MKRIIVAIATLLFIASANPASANQPGAIGPVTAYTVAVQPPAEPFHAPVLATGNLDIPLLGLALSILFFGAGRVWGK